MVECGGLENRCTEESVPGVRIPPSPLISILFVVFLNPLGRRIYSQFAYSKYSRLSFRN